jgi:hypothetical protein
LLKNVIIRPDQRLGNALPRRDGVDRRIVFGETLRRDQKRFRFVVFVKFKI